MKKNRHDLDRKEEKDCLVLIHGTFAEDEEKKDDGLRWWQNGSDFSESLFRKIGQDKRPPELFHWDGRNAQSSRSNSAIKLRDYIAKRKREGRRVHLVAHSHGGNIAWDACLDEETLKCVASLTTIGTPFFRLGEHKTAERLAVFVQAISLILVIAPVLAAFGIARSLQLDVVLVWAALALISAPLFQSLLTGYLHVSKRRMIPVLHALIASRSIEIYSKDDEAIVALDEFSRNKREIIPKPTLFSSTQFLSDLDGFMPAIKVVQLPLNALVWILMHAFRFFVNPLIWRSLKANALGADVRNVYLDGVSASPGGTDSVGPPLPIPIQTRLREGANEALKSRVDRIRPLLITSFGDDFSLIDGVRVAFRGESQPFLVHNSYFDCEFVIEVIAERILSTLRSGESNADEHLNDYLTDIRNYKNRVRSAVDTSRGLEIRSNAWYALELAILIASGLALIAVGSLVF